ncbi:MAG: alpha/beta fold hydrolase [Acidimicrobiales bacterium]|nr:alpha/beta fold hydrolase [Acidimicrobiales bacterium]
MAGHPEPDVLVSLSDGRRIGVDDRGAPDGVPVLFFHGTPDTRLARHPDDSIAADLGVRVIAPDRPGLGSSDTDPGATPLSVADDHLAVLDHLAVDRAHAVAWSAGTIHALALAGAHPDRVTSLTLVAPLVPADAYDDPRMLEGSDDARQLFAEHLGTMPPDELGRELAMWLVPPELDPVTAKAMLEQSVDRVAHVPGAGDALVQALLGSVHQGMTGLECEIGAQATVLGPLLDQVRAPVSVHAGDDDTVTPLAMATWLAERFDAPLRVHHAGHEIGITAWDEILRELDRG